jgi:hypothetical protein
VGEEDAMNQDRLMRVIRKNLAAVAASQRQSTERGERIDQQMKEISAEQRRIAQELDRRRASPRSGHKKR